MDAVSALMQERQRFEVWIAALEEKRAITPPHVYERVRGDYEARLREVVQKLIGRTSDLKETVAALTARLAKLQSDENAKRDERYEAELRATVGEFETDKWEKLRGAIDETVNRLANERTGVSTELARVQQILSMAGAAAGAAVGSDASRPRAAEPSAPSSAPPSGAGAGRPQGGRFDELAFLSSVVESAPAGGSSSGGGNGGQPPAGSPATNGAPPSSVPAPAAAPRAPSGRQPVQPPAPPPQPATVARQPTGANQPVITRPENSDGAVPSYLRDVPTETAKSLKCNECGTMNYPTEWYCERCGGELAAM
jgi:Skp family chaperone for outer membrane proteins